jgi:hypothetical protein
MLQSQQMAAVSGVQPRASGGRPPGKKAGTVRPSDIIALDDNDFGNF